MKKTIETIASFLEVNPTPEEIAGLVNHLHIENFKNNSTVNQSELRALGIMNETSQGFIRLGKQNKNKTKDEDALILPESAEKWIYDNLNKVGIRFP